MEKVKSTMAGSSIPELYGVGKDLNSTADFVLDSIILISKTAVKNRNMGFNFGNSLNFIIEALNQQIDLNDYEKSFKLFHKVALFKQMAQSVWHGSVIGACVDGNLDLFNMIAIGEQISNSVDLRADSSKAQQLWEDFKKIAKNQNNANLAQILANKKAGEDLTDKEIDMFIEVYDASADYIAEDYQRFKSLGYTREFFQSVNQYKDTFFLNSETFLLQNQYDFKIIEEAFDDELTLRSRSIGGQTGVSVNLFREFWLGFFRNQVAVPFDEFTYQCAIACQLLHQRLDLFFTKHLVKFLKDKAVELNYSVDLRRDKQFVKQVVNMISSKNVKAKPEESPQPRSTVPSKGGKSVSIPSKGFDLNAVKRAIKDIKAGHGPDLTIEIMQESFSLAENLQNLNLVGQRIKVAGDLSLYTFGNSFLNDFYLPKTGVMHGTQFALVHQNSVISIQDYSSVIDNLNVMLKCPRDTKTRLEENQIVSISASVDYLVEQYTNDHLKLRFLRHIKPPSNAYEPTLLADLPIPPQGLIVGRIKKGNDFTIGNKCCSTHHCIIHPNQEGITDTSSNGTFIYLKKHHEQVIGHQSQSIEFDKANYLIQFSDILIRVE